MTAALVLNASYEPLGVVALRRAVVLVLSEKAFVVEAGTVTLHSERQSLVAPSVVRLARYVRVPYRHSIPLSRRAVMARDRHICAYCTRRADTMDHVEPRSRGGRHEWTNVVAACASCNHRKGDRLLSELGWSLPTPPVQPTAPVALVLSSKTVEPVWHRYLGVADDGRSSARMPLAFAG